MKLHHFITAKNDDGAQRLQELGKVLAPEVKQVTEVKLAEIKNKPAKKKTEVDAEQEMRDFAVDQLASSTSHSAHHKIKHYD